MKLVKGIKCEHLYERTRKQVECDVRRYFEGFFTVFDIPDKLIEKAVDNVFDYSDIAVEGTYNKEDISLVCQVVVLKALEEF